MKLNKDENELNGKWLFRDKQIIPDDTCLRIQELTSNYLIKICSDSTGWDALYQDPQDKRYWELIYPESNMQGAGPPTLKTIRLEDAKKKYANDKLK